MQVDNLILKNFTEYFEIEKANAWKRKPYQIYIKFVRVIGYWFPVDDLFHSCIDKVMNQIVCIAHENVTWVWSKVIFC